MTKTSYFSTIPEIVLWPEQRSDVLNWLMKETSSHRFLDDILAELCERLKAVGVPVARSSLHLRIQHPQWQGTRILWFDGCAKSEVDTFSYDVDTTEVFLRRPTTELYHGAAEIRQNLEFGNPIVFSYPLFTELLSEGYTDYVAWPIQDTWGRRHVLTFASSRKGGFNPCDIQLLRDLVPALALVAEVRMKNAMARTLLETYVGPHASAEILAGATRRGSGKTVHAAVMVCDLRRFTELSELWSRDEIIELLNGYFDALCEPVEARGGEILKFMGDGLLAIFPLDRPSACTDLIDAIEEGENRMAIFNGLIQWQGKLALNYGVGVHVGDVMYGNIGSKGRLDFTAIGPAVNVASRLEELTKKVGRPVLLSQDFVKLVDATREFSDLGEQFLRGISRPVRVFAIAE